MNIQVGFKFWIEYIINIIAEENKWFRCFISYMINTVIEIYQYLIKEKFRNAIVNCFCHYQAMKI